MKWKCPKCGREFSRQNQDHYCIKPQNIDEYISSRDAEATAVFKDELKGFDVSKGAIRLPYSQALPAELIERIARWCYEKYRK